MSWALHVKYPLHSNSYNNMDNECVYIEFDKLYIFIYCTGIVSAKKDLHVMHSIKFVIKMPYV